MALRSRSPSSSHMPVRQWPQLATLADSYACDPERATSNSARGFCYNVAHCSRSDRERFSNPNHAGWRASSHPWRATPPPVGTGRCAPEEEPVQVAAARLRRWECRQRFKAWFCLYCGEKGHLAGGWPRHPKGPKAQLVPAPLHSAGWHTPMGARGFAG